jgi:hypothetical protein
MQYPICTLLALLLLSRTAHSATPIVLFTHQSQHLLFQNWVEYITLCFAPLVAHLVGGVSSPIIIPSDSKPPSWSACLPHYNPTSVVWRWYAISDRRVRACSWDAADMAACNAVFWDSKKARWDGSEDIMLRSRAWIVKLPRQTYVPLLSASSFTTAVLTLQGVLAGFLIFASLNPQTTYHLAQGLPSVFIPLAILGLMRLPVALWLSDDYTFLDLAHNGSSNESHITETLAGEMEEPKRTTPTATALISPLSPTNSHIPELTTSDKCRVHSIHSAIGLLYRVWWFLSISGLLSAAAVATTRILWGNLRSFRYLSLSHLLENVMYFILSTTTILITCTYILLGRTHSTLIPCIHETWYKMLTVLIVAMGFATIIVAVLETRQLHDGTISTLPEFQCNQTSGLCVPVARGHGNFNT